MKKIYFIIGLMSICLFSSAQNFPVDFESSGMGASWTWTVFESGVTPPPLEIVANPDPSGINTSATVAKFTALQVGQPFAGCETSHGADVGTFSIDASNAIITMMVYKTKISDVGFKLVTSSSASLGVVKVANTVINEWEMLTFDFSSHINSVHNPFDQIVIFPDWESRTTDDVIFFDNIAGGCVSNSTTLSVTSCSIYTSPSGNVLTSTGVYMDTLTNVWGCDSIITINLTIPSLTTVTVQSCSFFTAPSGAVLTSTGVYMDTLPNPNIAGCDSIIIIDLTVVITDQAIAATQPSVCTGGATTIDVASSQVGVSYFLRNDFDNTIIDGPTVGTGGALLFNTGVINSDMTYNVYAESNTVPSEGLSFDGIDDYINTNIDINESVYPELTFEAWVYPTETYSGVRQTIFSHSNGDYDRGLSIEAGTSKWFLTTGGGLWATADVDLNQWQHIAVVYDNANNAVRFYKNGVEYTVMEPPVTSYSGSVNKMWLGRNPSLNQPFEGSMDGVKAWSVQRSSTEIMAGMDVCLIGNETGLIGYYKFDDGAGSTTAADASSEMNNATLGVASASPTWGVGKEECASCSAEFSSTALVTIACVGVEDNSFEGNVVMFPNPTNGRFAITFENVQKKVRVRLLSTTGKFIKEYQFIDSKIVQLETSLPSGMYLVEVLNDDLNKAMFKLIKK